MGLDGDHVQWDFDVVVWVLRGPHYKQVRICEYECPN